MRLLQRIPERRDTLRLADIQLVELNRHVAAVLAQHAGFLERGVVAQRLHGLGAAGGGARGQVDCEGTGFEGRGGVGEGEVAD